MKDGFRANETRGCSYLYSHDAVCAFLNTNGLRCLIRAHEVQVDGFKKYPKNLATNFPSVISIFSAPNYCDLYGNKGAVINLVHGAMDIVQFTAQDHPYHLPNFMDVFAWSLPFVCENLSELLHAILHAEINQSPASPPNRSRLRSKARAVGKMLTLMKTVRNEREKEVAEEGLSYRQIERRDSLTERQRPPLVSSELVDD